MRPKVVVEVAFTEWTDDGRLRHPSFQGIREDEAAAAVKIEKEQPASATRQDGFGTDGEEHPDSNFTREGLILLRRPRKRGRRERRRVRARRPWPACGSATRSGGLSRSRSDEARRGSIFRGGGGVDAAYVADRPLSVVRCTGGLGGGKGPVSSRSTQAARPARQSKRCRCASQREWPTTSRSTQPRALVSARMGVLEVHPWGSKAKMLEKPDLVVFDLDPAPGLPFGRVKEGAIRIRDVLGGMGVKSWLKTSGGKGLHVVVPLKPSTKVTWEMTKSFAEQVPRGSRRRSSRPLPRQGEQERAEGEGLHRLAAERAGSDVGGSVFAPGKSRGGGVDADRVG